MAVIHGTSIYAVAEGSSWSQAQANAEKLGGNLVTINNAEENIFVFKNFGFEDDVAISSGYWIGLTDQIEEGNWKWSSNESSGWTPYGWGLAGHEPNGNGDYAWIKVGFDTPEISYEQYVSASNDHWLNTGQPLWEERGPSWDDTWESGEGTNYGVAEIPYFQYGNSAYVVVDGPSWQQAEANAIALGGHLVTINNQSENDWIYNQYLTADEDALHIGLIESNDGVYIWASGDDVTYTNWNAGEPNGGSDGEASQFGHIYTHTGFWNDHPVSTIRGLAEIPLSKLAVNHPNEINLSLNYSILGIDEDFLGLVEPQPKEVKRQIAVLGDSVDHSSRYDLNVTANILNQYNLEGADITIGFDAQLFNNINASDITIGSDLPIANAVQIDNELGTIRLAAAALADVTQNGIGVSGETVLASISLDFDETALATIAKNDDGSLITNPLSFSISANLDETIVSSALDDGSGYSNRTIQSLRELGGTITVDGQDVTLYEAKINFEQQGDGLVLGTERIIGADASFTNLIRSGDTLTTSVDWLNVGNIQANNLSYSEVYNQNASLASASFSQTSVASGSFIDGVFVQDARESTTLTTDILVSGQAGNVLDLSDGIVSIQADGSETFTNSGKGSSNLITFQGDLNYDGRVSMKDLAYLNAGAARQQTTTDDPTGLDADQNGIVDATVARDVDADFNGRIDLADLAVLDADWGKTLHIGDEQFQGSADVSWSELDSQGTSTTWENASFKDQNAIEADANYVGSLESPTASGVIGADGNTSANDGDITGTNFQDPIPA